MDISWQALGRIVRDWGGTSAELAEVNPLDGGCISTTVALRLTDGRQAVCKLSVHRVDRSYLNESHQLKLLAELGLPVPRVYAAKIGSLEDPFSYILMEFIDGVNLNQAKAACSTAEFDDLQSQLALIILKLHEKTDSAYVRVEIAPEPARHDAWPVFYRHLYEPILAEVLKTSALPIKCRKQIGKIHERLDRLLDHEDRPRLVHWDVWSTNILARRESSGTWKIAALLDPNCKFAHYEAEIAYLSLFATATPAFMKAYQQVRRLGDDYHKLRKPIYQLYFLMNHLYLFGGDYARRVAAAVEGLSGVI
jgi:fructosamine-3-kinase